MRKSHKEPKRRIAVLDGLQYFLFLCVVNLVRAFSLKWAYRLARFFGSAFYFMDPLHRGRCIRHLLHSGVCADEASAKALARKNLIHMAKLFVEIVKCDQLVTEATFEEHFRLADDEVTRRVMSKAGARQCIVVASHLGNWEMAGHAFTHYTGMRLTSIMHPLGNQRIGAYFYAHRMDKMHETVSKELGLRPLFLACKNGSSIAIVADQHASSREGVEVTFFNHPARAHATPAMLHLQAKLPIITAYLVRLDDDFHFELHCSDYYTDSGVHESIQDAVKDICQYYTSEIEKAVAAWPEQWIWAHRRWLDIERKSAYANPVGQGEKEKQ